MKLDSEWELLSQEWQRETLPMPGLKVRVQRESRTMRWILASEILVTLVIGGGAGVWATIAHDIDVTVLAGAVWVFIATAWTFAAIVRKGNWSASGVDTASFLDLSIRRCRMSIATAYFGIALCIVEVGFCLAWVRHYLGRTQVFKATGFWLSPAVLPYYVITAGVIAGCLWYRNKRAREMESLLNFKRHIENVEYNSPV